MSIENNNTILNEEQLPQETPAAEPIIKKRIRKSIRNTAKAKAPAAVPEKKVSALLEQAKTKGALTSKEITDVLEDLDFDGEQIETLYESLENMNIEVIEDLSTDIDLNFDPASVENDPS